MDAREGAVLLKNEEGILPLKKGQKIAVFGKAQIDYIKGVSGSGGVHTAYNRINGVHASESAELLTGILRRVWGSDGMVSSDRENTAEHYKEVKAGTDVHMPGNQEELLSEPYEKGLLSRDEMATCVK